MYLFELSLGIVLAIYIKEVFAGFPRINDVFLVIVYFSVILFMLWLSSEMKRNLIIA
jgi:hypothetical protein